MTQESMSPEAVAELRQALAELLAALQPAFRYRVGLLGDGNGNLKGTRPDYWYVRILGNQSNRIEVFGRRISGGEGTPVIVGRFPWAPDLEQILDVDWEAYANANLWSSQQSYLPQHGFTHISYGTDPAAIDKGNIVPFHTHVYSGSVITAFADFYPYQNTRQFWPGGSINATPYMTGSSHFITAYINPVNNTLNLINGLNLTGSPSAYAGIITLTPSLVSNFFPTPPVASLICGTFLWVEGDTDIKTTHTFYDRLWWHPLGGGGGGTINLFGTGVPIPSIESGAGSVGTFPYAAHADHVHPATTSSILRRQVLFTFKGALSVQVGQIGISNEFGVAQTIDKVKLLAGTAPTGAQIKADVNLAGITIFTTQTNRPQIAAGAQVGESALIDVTTWGTGVVMTADIDQVGVGPGNDLTVEVIIHS